MKAAVAEQEEDEWRGVRGVGGDFGLNTMWFEQEKGNTRMKLGIKAR